MNQHRMTLGGRGFAGGAPNIHWQESPRYGSGLDAARTGATRSQVTLMGGSPVPALEVTVRGVQVRATEGVVRTVLDAAIKLAPYALCYLVVDRICHAVETVSED